MLQEPIGNEIEIPSKINLKSVNNRLDCHTFLKKVFQKDEAFNPEKGKDEQELLKLNDGEIIYLSCWSNVSWQPNEEERAGRYIQIMKSGHFAVQ